MRGIGDPAGLVQGVAMMGLFDKKKAEPPQPEYTEEVGWTQPFVLGKGFTKAGEFRRPDRRRQYQTFVC